MESYGPATPLSSGSPCFNAEWFRDQRKKSTVKMETQAESSDLCQVITDEKISRFLESCLSGAYTISTRAIRISKRDMSASDCNSELGSWNHQLLSPRAAEYQLSCFSQQVSQVLKTLKIT